METYQETYQETVETDQLKNPNIGFVPNLVSVIVNVGSWFAAVPATKKHFGQVSIILISQLINGISRVLQNYLDF